MLVVRVNGGEWACIADISAKAYLRRCQERNISLKLKLALALSKQVKSFLGLVGYCRQHIATCFCLNNSSTECHLRQHQPKSIEMEWITVFNQTKQAFILAPLLSTPNVILPYQMHSDAWDTQIYTTMRDKGSLWDKFLQQLLSAGIIRPSSSPWSSAVPKKTRDVRICVDFRAIHSLTLPDLLVVISSVNYLTTLDLSKCYHRIKLTEFYFDLWFPM